MYEEEKGRILEEKAIGNKPDKDDESKKSKSSTSEELGDKEKDFNSYRTYEVLKVLENDEELIQDVTLKRF